MNIQHHEKPGKVVFLNELEIKSELRNMVKDAHLNTATNFVKNKGSSNQTTFYTKHWSYLKTHPKINPEIYLANLKTMIRIRYPN